MFRPKLTIIRRLIFSSYLEAAVTAIGIGTGTHTRGTGTSSHPHKHTRDDQEINIYNDNEDRTFHVRAGFLTLIDGHFSPKDVVKTILSDF
jgi:hypothetical protein